MNVDVKGALSVLAERRPVFHSERDFQHALAWQLQLAGPQAQIRLETRPRRGVHLDLLVTADGMRTAVEVKYLVAGLQASVRRDRAPRHDQEVKKEAQLADAWEKTCRATMATSRCSAGVPPGQRPPGRERSSPHTC